MSALPKSAHLYPKRGTALGRWVGRTILRLMGWKIRGVLPPERKCILIGAPHTSNWDLILAMGSMLAVGLRFSWMMKREAFVWPLGPLWKSLGGVPIDRRSKNALTTQMADWFAANDIAYLGITPEGTRSHVESFRKGYLRIAQAANVPVFVIGIEARRKEVVLDRLWPLSGDVDADNAAIEAYYADNYVGIRPRARKS